MLVLFETAAGYAIFKLKDEKKLQQTENLYKDFETPEGAGHVVKLKYFKKFADTTDALAATTAAVEGKMSKHLKKMLKKVIAEGVHDKLAVADAKLGGIIKEKLNLNCVSNTSIQELMRCIRSQLDSLVGDLPKKEMAAMSLGLAHSLSRYKLKFSPDKVDTMIVQAVNLLDELDKELNNYVMRCKEWYGWHFPELSKIITDNMMYIRAVQAMGFRTNASQCDFSQILPEELEAEVKTEAEISTGTEISDEDLTNILNLCEQVLEIGEYRTQLYDYLKNRMIAIAPNLTILVGELVGARLMSHAGSLLNLAKHPASTVQILGAEKALFRALKSRNDTPKYGLIYHAQMVGQTNAKIKGKVSRMLAAKAALACRVDALGEEASCDLGTEHKAKLEARLKQLEDGTVHRISGLGKHQAQHAKFTPKGLGSSYSAGADSTLPIKTEIKQEGEEEEEEAPKKKKRKKSTQQSGDDEEAPKKKRKKSTQQSGDDESPKKKKKKSVSQ